MRVGTNRKYTKEFRTAAVKQVLEGGRSMASVARSLERSPQTLANGVFRARQGEALIKRDSVLWSVDQKPVTEWEAEVTRLRQENTRLRVEKEILMAPGHLEKAAAYFAKESMGGYCQLKLAMM